MKKPSNLTQLIEELEGEAIVSLVEAPQSAKVHIHLSEDAITEDDPITLNAEEARLLLANEGTIERLFEALGNPEDASITLEDVILPDAALDALERMFTAVDE